LITLLLGVHARICPGVVRRLPRPLEIDRIVI
jgi:hypothetical protein